MYAYGICNNVFKNGPRKICGRQPSKTLLDPSLNKLSYM